MRRLIIALDQDNFYVSVAQRLDPSLEGLPIGITPEESPRDGFLQGEGVRTGQAPVDSEPTDTQHAAQHDVQPAPNGGPELVLVDGEDLSSYRRAGRAVKLIVDAVVGGDGERGAKRKRGEAEYTTRTFPGAEKLGMDEFNGLKPQIDMDVLADLPKEIREEMMQRYGLASGTGWDTGEVIELSDDEDSVVDVQPLKHCGNEATVPKVERPSAISPNAQGTETYPSLNVLQGETPVKIKRLQGEDPALRNTPPTPPPELDGTPCDIGSSASDDDEDKDGRPFSRCGAYIFGFAADAHARWHERVEQEDK